MVIIDDSNKALFPLVQSFIEFDALMLQARRALEDYANKSWSNTDEHDPGITLLEAMCYNASDLAYRSSLPVKDLLTPRPQDQKNGEGIFPVSFGPQQALTCGPISEDDYRRALLDLRCVGPEGEYFCFSNVKLVREPQGESYRYWYDKQSREYTFVRIEGSNSSEITLLGNYHLYLQPSRETEANGHQAADSVLQDYLREHRNIGESVARIIWLKPANIMVNAVIELVEGFEITTSVAGILAAIFTVIEDYITPPTTRYSTEELQAQGLSNDEIYQGPYLRNGWVLNLPPPLEVNNPVTVNLLPLVNNLLSIDGVKSLQTFGAGPEPGNSWEWTAPTGSYPLLWGRDPIQELAGGAFIKLIVNGIERTATVAEICRELATNPVYINPEIILPYSRWRNPAEYYPLTDLIPPCYGLQNFPNEMTLEQIQLHQFLLPFEQLLANGCQQLALLPDLLSFNRKKNDIVWGEQWPFPPGSISDEIFKGYADEIEIYLKECSKNMGKELSYVNYLLGYFNASIAPKLFAVDADRFMNSQQSYLSEISTLTYDRANIRVDRVSALQRRIAARLGIGGADLFNDIVPLDSLPFYIVEHRGLLPSYPDPFYNSQQSPKRLYQEDGNLIVVLPAIAAPLKVGQLVNILLTENGADFVIRALMVSSFSQQTSSFSIMISSNAQLERNLEKILDPANTVYWENCQVWLEDMNFPLVYDVNQTGLAVSERRLTSSPQSPYPMLVQLGDILILERRVGVNTNDRHAESSLKMEVIQADSVSNTLVVKSLSGGAFPSPADARHYFWYFDSEIQATSDKFSFVVSVIFNRDDLVQVPNDVRAADAWVKSAILEEFPSHISMLLHWMPEDQFKNFAYTYAAWQGSAGSLGDASYSILRMLTLGSLPTSVGIGYMRIATDVQRLEVVGENGDEWNTDFIIENDLFFIPPNP